MDSNSDSCGVLLLQLNELNIDFYLRLTRNHRKNHIRFAGLSGFIAIFALTFLVSDGLTLDYMLSDMACITIFHTEYFIFL